jgi:2-dehydro-3-deoxygluconokinase
MNQPSRVVFFGELLLRLSPPANEMLLQSPRLDARFGGAEANVASSLSIFGHHSVMVSALPDQAIGHACAGELRRHGVDTSALRFNAGRMGVYFLTPGAMQRPAEVLYDRADSVFARTPVSAYDWPRLLDGAQWLHLSGINLALCEDTAEAALTAMRVARSLGVRVSFDGNFRSKLWGERAAQAPAWTRRAMAEADLIFGNDRDMGLALGMAFSQTQADERFHAAARAAFHAFPHLRHMAATERRHDNVDDQHLSGLLANRDGAQFATVSHAMTGIVDRIGGGDAFAAGLLHGFLRGLPQQASLDFAVAAACLKHSVPGDVNLVREADVQAYLQQEGFEVRR